MQAAGPAVRSPGPLRLLDSCPSGSPRPVWGSPTAGGLSAGQPVILGSPTSPGLFRRWGMHGACLLAVGTELCEFTCGSGGCAPGGGSPPPSLPGGGVLWALCPAGPGGCHVVRTGHSGLLPIWRDSPLPTHTSCGFWPRAQIPCPGGWWTQARPAPPATSSPREPGGGPCTRAPNPSGRSRQPPSHSASTVAAEADAKPSSVAETRHFWSAGGSAQGPTGSRRPVAPSPWHTGAPRPQRWWPRWVLGKRPPLCWTQLSGSQRAGAGSSCQQKVEMEPPDPLQGGVRRSQRGEGGRARVTQHVGGPPP